MTAVMLSAGYISFFNGTGQCTLSDPSAYPHIQCPPGYYRLPSAAAAAGCANAGRPCAAVSPAVFECFCSPCASVPNPGLELVAIPVRIPELPNGAGRSPRIFLAHGTSTPSPMVGSGCNQIIILSHRVFPAAGQRHIGYGASNGTECLPPHLRQAAGALFNKKYHLIRFFHLAVFVARRRILPCQRIPSPSLAASLSLPLVRRLA